MSDRVISLYALDAMLAKLCGMYHIEDIRAMISKIPAAEIEEKITVKTRCCPNCKAYPCTTTATPVTPKDRIRR